jgi:hypothetical protein
MTATTLLQLLAPPVTASYAAIAAKQKPWFVSESGTCQVFRFLVGDVNCFTFGPTEDWQEWAVDFMAVQIPVHDHPDFGPVHLGFWNDMQSSLVAVRHALADLGWPPWFGAWHSKGGEGELAAAQLTSEGHPPLALANYETPCVGGPLLTAFFKARNVPIFGTTTMNQTGADIVTQIPDGPMWEHQGVQTVLTVPDAYGIAQKHEWPAVLASLGALDAALA